MYRLGVYAAGQVLGFPVSTSLTEMCRTTPPACSSINGIKRSVKKARNLQFALILASNGKAAGDLIGWTCTPSARSGWRLSQPAVIKKRQIPMTIASSPLRTWAATAALAFTLAAGPALASPTLYAESAAGTGDLVASAEWAGSVGTGGLTITGNLLDGKGGFTPNLSDLFGFTISKAGTYRFDTFGSNVADPALFLFDADGKGLFWNNDASVAPVDTQSAFSTMLAAGTYYIGFAFYGVDPDDGTELGMFDTVGSNEGFAMPDAGALTAWMDFYGQTIWDFTGYQININGVVPEPGVLALAFGGLALAAAARRRRSDRA